MTHRALVHTGTLLAGCMALAAAASAALAAGPAQTADDTPPMIAADGKIVPGPPITPQQLKSARHPRYPAGWTCAECHDVSFGVDFVSSASRQYASNFQALPQEAIWERIVQFLPGRERFTMASSSGDRPLATTVDMVLDREEKVFYVVSEKGTEKLMQLQQNPQFSAVRADGWTVAGGGARQWISVQVNGEAELIPATDPRFLPTLEKYSLVRISTERAVRRFDIQRITPQEIVLFDTTLLKDGRSPYQYWERPAEARPETNAPPH
ncbi:MAG: pyridoxamine 5'-phosphate oxidase family protein [Steroidobacteraceae bacterium]|nr:pyridoxamine 5'-phosphate oxidase family protein [Nevskiaceae bacterium]